MGDRDEFSGRLLLPFQLVSVQRHEGSPVSNAQVSLSACMFPSVFMYISELAGSIDKCSRGLAATDSSSFNVEIQSAVLHSEVLFFVSSKYGRLAESASSYLPTSVRRRDILLELDVQGCPWLEGARQ